MSISVVKRNQGVLPMNEKEIENKESSNNYEEDQNYSNDKIPYLLTIILQIMVFIWLIMHLNADFKDKAWGLWSMILFIIPGISMGLYTIIVSFLYISHYKDPRYLFCIVSIITASLIGVFVSVSATIMY
jgi:hypothetical protein